MFTGDPGWSGLDRFLAKAAAAQGKVRRSRIELAAPGGPRHLRLKARLVSDPGSGAPLAIALIIRDVTERVRAWRRRVERGLLRQLLVTTFAVGLVVNAVAAAYVPIEAYSVLIAWLYLFALLVPATLFLRRLAHPLALCGVTFANWRKAVREGVILSAVLVPLAVAMALGRHVADGATDDLWAVSLPDLIDPKELQVLTILYLPHAFLQEFVARGVLQSSIERLIGDVTGWRSVAIASGIFGAHHFYLGAIAVAVTFVAGLFLGWFYRRHGNLIGVTLVHFSAGWVAFMFNLI